MIGTSLYKLLPGNKAFPFHCHYGNEEAIFILSGNGTLRLGGSCILSLMNSIKSLPMTSLTIQKAIQQPPWICWVK